MSRVADIPASVGWFIGERKVLEFEIFATEPSAAGVTPVVVAVMKDMAGLTMEYALRKTVVGKSPHVENAAVVSLVKTTTIVVQGAFNANRTLNAQRVRVPIDPIDYPVDMVGGRYVEALAITTAGQEAVISHGVVELLSPATRDEEV